MARKRPEEYYQPTKSGSVVRTETREHDRQRLVTVYNDSDLLDLMPVDNDEELSQWFHYYVAMYGGEDNGG